MPRYVALLRAINVGGHTVKMDALRAHFEALRFGRVESVIASGNIMFDTKVTDTAAIETRIEKRLLSSLGYRVDSCVRTGDELAAVVAHSPFRADDPIIERDILQVIFLKTAPDVEAVRRLLALSTAYDDFAALDREIYWRTRGRSSDSTITGAMFARAVSILGTARNITTVRKLAAKLASGA